VPQLWQNSVFPGTIIKKQYSIHLIVLVFVILSVINLRNTGLIDWDEGVFALQGQWLATLGADGKPFNFQTPPLFQILIALLFKIVGSHDIVLPLLSLVFSGLTLYFIFYLATYLFSEEEAIFTVIIFMATEFFLFFSTSGLSDATFLFFFITSIFFFIKSVERNRTSDFLLTMFCTTLALYTKYSGITLPLIFIIIGYFYRKQLRRRWFLFSIIIPIIVFIPYIYLFFRFVQIHEIGSRHVSLLGINHMKYLLYLFIFAPIPLILSLIYVVVSFKKLTQWDSSLLIMVLIFFIVLGFYYPFFRLLYPLIPFLSILAARVIVQTHRYKTYLLMFSILVSIALGAQTIFYKRDVPRNVAKYVNRLAEEENIHVIYTIVPPNVYFYISGSIAVPINHPWFAIGKKFPVLLEKKKIMYPEDNQLLSQEKIILVHATAADSMKQKNNALYSTGTLLKSIEFIDAPVYYKDIYNPQRNIKQIYEIYEFNTKTMDEHIDDLWRLGFDRHVEVIFR
jgi:hypothetical protein